MPRANTKAQHSFVLQGEKIWVTRLQEQILFKVWNQQRY